MFDKRYQLKYMLPSALEIITSLKFGTLIGNGYYQLEG